MGFINKLKQLFNRNNNTDLWVEHVQPQKKIVSKETKKTDKYDNYPITILEDEDNLIDNYTEESISHAPYNTDYTETNYWDGNVIDTNNVYETSYSIVNHKLEYGGLQKHIVYITTNNITTQFYVERDDITRYDNKFYKLAIEQVVYEGCKHHETRVDSNYKVEPNIINNLINDIYNDYIISKILY